MINFITREGTSEGVVAALVSKETVGNVLFTPMFLDPQSAYPIVNKSINSGCQTVVFDIDYKKHLVCVPDVIKVNQILWIDNHTSSNRSTEEFLYKSKNVPVMKQFLDFGTVSDVAPSVATKTLAQCLISGDNEISRMLYAFVSAYGSATAYNILDSFPDYNFLNDENAKKFIFDQKDRLETYYDSVVGVQNLALLVGANVDKFNDLTIVSKELLSTGYNIVASADRDRNNNWILKVSSTNYSTQAFITFLLSSVKVLFKGGASSNEGSGVFHVDHYKSSRQDIEDILKKKYLEFLEFRAAAKKKKASVVKKTDILTATLGEIVK